MRTLEELVNDTVYADLYNDTVSLDGHLSLKELKMLVAFMETLGPDECGLERLQELNKH